MCFALEYWGTKSQFQQLGLISQTSKFGLFCWFCLKYFWTTECTANFIWSTGPCDDLVFPLHVDIWVCWSLYMSLFFLLRWNRISSFPWYWVWVFCLFKFSQAQLALVQAKATAEVAQAKQLALEKDIRLKSADLALANLKRVWSLSFIIFSKYLLSATSNSRGLPVGTKVNLKSWNYT